MSYTTNCPHPKITLDFNGGGGGGGASMGGGGRVKFLNHTMRYEHVYNGKLCLSLATGHIVCII